MYLLKVCLIPDTTYKQSQFQPFLYVDNFPARGGGKSTEGALPIGFSSPFCLLFAAMAKSKKAKKRSFFPFHSGAASASIKN
jgi:hypothetical protein